MERSSPSVLDVVGVVFYLLDAVEKELTGKRVFLPCAARLSRLLLMGD